MKNPFASPERYLLATQILLVLVVLLALIVVRQFFRDFRGRKNLRRYSRLTPREIEPLLRKWGGNSNSFLSLYQGFHYFTSYRSDIDGVIPFVSTLSAWVAAAEPLADPKHHEQLLREFAIEAERDGKVALMIPVGAATVATATRAGYGALMIGTEPTFLLDRYYSEIEMVPSAKQCHNRGGRVREFRREDLLPAQREELELIIDDWLASRKMVPLRFLNRVAPWEVSGLKKYFLIESHDRILAFVAAIPFWARNGWYLIDLLRRTDAPPGTTELLILESMRFLKSQGAQVVTLGVAPLSGMESAPSGRLSWLYRILGKVYARGNLLYNFQPLHQFKLKFNPTLSEQSFMIFSPPRLGAKAIFGIIEAFIPGGVFQAAWSGALRMMQRIDFTGWMGTQLAANVVVRSVPRSPLRLLYRCKGILILATILIIFFVWSTDAHWKLRSELATEYGFSVQGLLNDGPTVVLLSPFLHWGLGHLVLNLVMLFGFVGILEFLAGTLFMLLCYILGGLITNPLCALLLLLPMRWMDLGAWTPLTSEIDVGASLGIWSCAGALTGFLRKGRWLLGGLILGALGAVAVQGSFFQLNHIIALFIGISASKFLLRS